VRVISLGAGVQSTTLLLLANHGELPGDQVDAAIFADTEWEPRAVYQHLDWLEQVSEIPIYRVGRSSLRQDALDPELSRNAAMPVFVAGPKGGGIAPRQCTREYKVRPIERKLRELLGSRRTGTVDLLMGISLDEVERMKVNPTSWITNHYPLIDKRMSRHDCLRWLELHGYPEPPKSACIGCPYHSDAAWRRLRDESPDEWQDAVDFDAAMRAGPFGGLKYPAYLHGSLKPLPMVDLSTPADAGQLDLFAAECEGYCGL
jgi:hypothetical protein